MASTPGTPRLLRAINDRAALELLLEHGPISRTQLGALAGLSKPTASQLLARLETAGLVIRVGLLEGSRGPSAQLYEINPAAAHVAGVDVTAQRIDAAVADITGRVVAEHLLPTPRSAVGVPTRVRKVLEVATGEAGLDISDLRHVVIGTPGAINPSTGQLAYARHLPGWHSPTVLDDIRAELGTTVDVENDVNLVALAELWEGRATASENFALLWASEGLGLAIVLGGEIHRGATGGAGEVGYLPVPGAPLRRDVGRGADFGFQTTAGANAVVKLARDHRIRGRTAPEAVARAAAAGPDSPFLRELAERMAVGMAAIVSVLDPELIVLAGDIPLAGGETLRALVETELYSHALPRPTVLLSSVAGNSVRAGAIHAALTVARDAVFGSTVPGSVPGPL